MPPVPTRPATIAVGGFQHETNSFAPQPAGYDWFTEHRDRPPLVRGDDVIAALAGASYALSGFLAALRPGDAVRPLVWASGGAGGTVTDDAFERIAGELVARLAAAGPVDAVYLDLHGAMVTETYDDAEAELLRRVRAEVGAVPIVISLDYHANVSPEMVAGCDALAICRTYPHVDRPETGARAAAMLLARLASGPAAGRALRKPPFLLPLDAQCTLVEPSRSLVQGPLPVPGEPHEAGQPEFGYAAGFPPADTHWCGPALVVHARTQAEADHLADAWHARFVAAEARFRTPLWPAAAGVAEALRLGATARRPIILADTRDNPGAGGSGDTTGLLQALLDHDVPDALLGYLCDAAAADAAWRAGIGATLDVVLGGRHGPAGVEPVRDRFRVLALAEGPFRMTGRVAGDVTADLGRLALLACRGVRVAVTSRRVQAFDPAPFHRLGADPSRARILALKSSCHFRADFEPLAEAVLTVLAPGVYDPDAANYPYRRLRAGVRLGPGG